MCTSVIESIIWSSEYFWWWSAYNTILAFKAGRFKKNNNKTLTPVNLNFWFGNWHNTCRNHLILLLQSPLSKYDHTLFLLIGEPYIDRSRGLLHKREKIAIILSYPPIRLVKNVHSPLQILCIRLALYYSSIVFMDHCTAELNSI